MWNFMIERKQKRQKIIWTGHKLMEILLRQPLLCQDEEVRQEAVIVEEDILLQEEVGIVGEEEEDFLPLLVVEVIEEEVLLVEEVFHDLALVLDLYQEDEREATQDQGHDHQQQRREEARLPAEAGADLIVEVDLHEASPDPQGDRLFKICGQFITRTKQNVFRCSSTIQLVTNMI